MDLDDSKVIKSCGDEDVLMCSKLLKSLKISLNLAINSTVLPDNSRNVILSDALIDFFVENCGHYSKFIVTKENEKILIFRLLHTRIVLFAVRGVVEYRTVQRLKINWQIALAFLRSKTHLTQNGRYQTVQATLQKFFFLSTSMMIIIIMATTTCMFTYIYTN